MSEIRGHLLLTMGYLSYDGKGICCARYILLALEVPEYLSYDDRGYSVYYGGSQGPGMTKGPAVPGIRWHIPPAMGFLWYL